MILPCLILSSLNLSICFSLYLFTRRPLCLSNYLPTDLPTSLESHSKCMGNVQTLSLIVIYHLSKIRDHCRHAHTHTLTLTLTHTHSHSHSLTPYQRTHTIHACKPSESNPASVPHVCKVGDNTPFTPHSTLYTPHSTLHTPHSTLYTPHCTLYTPHFTLHTLHFRLHPLPHSTVYSALVR